MREHNIQNIAHLSYYTNANGLLLVVLIKRGSAQFSLHSPARPADPQIPLTSALLCRVQDCNQSVAYASRSVRQCDLRTDTGRGARLRQLGRRAAPTTATLPSSPPRWRRWSTATRRRPSRSRCATTSFPSRRRISPCGRTGTWRSWRRPSRCRRRRLRQTAPPDGWWPHSVHDIVEAWALDEIAEWLQRCTTWHRRGGLAHDCNARSSTGSASGCYRWV